MFRQLIDILNSDEFIDGDETIQFAKGKNKGAETLKEALKQNKRLWQRK